MWVSDTLTAPRDMLVVRKPAEVWEVWGIKSHTIPYLARWVVDKAVHGRARAHHTLTHHTYYYLCHKYNTQPVLTSLPPNAQIFTYQQH